MKTPYEKMIRMMQKEGARRNPPCIRIGTASSDSKLRLGEIDLEADDLIMCDGTTLKKGYDYAIYAMPDDMYLVLGRVRDEQKPRITTGTAASGTTIVIDGETCGSSKLLFLNSLTMTAGYTYAVHRMPDDKWLVLGRV